MLQFVCEQTIMSRNNPTTTAMSS